MAKHYSVPHPGWNEPGFVRDDCPDEKATAEFVVFGNGRELWRSGSVKKSDPPKRVELTITGVRKLTLKTSGPEANASRTQADWVEPVVSKHDE